MLGLKLNHVCKRGPWCSAWLIQAHNKASGTASASDSPHGEATCLTSSFSVQCGSCLKIPMVFWHDISDYGSPHQSPTFPATKLARRCPRSPLAGVCHRQYPATTPNSVHLAVHPRTQTLWTQPYTRYAPRITPPYRVLTSGTPVRPLVTHLDMTCWALTSSPRQRVRHPSHRHHTPAHKEPLPRQQIPWPINIHVGSIWQRTGSPRIGGLIGHKKKSARGHTTGAANYGRHFGTVWCSRGREGKRSETLEGPEMVTSALMNTGVTKAWRGVNDTLIRLLTVAEAAKTHSLYQNEPGYYI